MAADFDETDRRQIGAVVGNAGTTEFTFILQQFQARVGDIVMLDMAVPDGAYRGQASIYVWARITDIRRFNPFFPFEAARELADEGIALEDTVLSDARDQLEAVCLILGATPRESVCRSLAAHLSGETCVAGVPPAGGCRPRVAGGRPGA